MITFYDKDNQPMDVQPPIVIGALFAIAAIDGPSSNGLVGVFLEDDDNYFLQSTFDKFWLKDLAEVAQGGVGIFKIGV